MEKLVLVAAGGGVCIAAASECLSRDDFDVRRTAKTAFGFAAGTVGFGLAFSAFMLTMIHVMPDGLK